jgi:transcriptional regulator with XRE-family HTH domain
MRQQGHTQEQVAATIGVPRKTLADWENGSIGDFAITSIPDLRLKIPKGAKAGGRKESSRGSYTVLRDDAPTLAEIGATKYHGAT